MSRHMRSIVSFAQTAGAGPSTRPLQAAYLRSPTFSPRRHASLTSIVPDFLKPKAIRERGASDVEKQTEGKESEVPEDPNEKGIFQGLAEQQKKLVSTRKAPLIHKSYTHESKTHQISPQKLNLLANQIAGLPIDEAIVQMQFSAKKASRWIREDLEAAKEQAIYTNNMDKSTLIVAAAWVNKAKYGPKQLDFRARGRFGVKQSPFARLLFTLSKGLTPSEKQSRKLQKEVNKYARGASIVREDVPLRRKVISNWAW